MESAKVYVEMLARFTEGGELEPVCFTWEDGQRYEIDRVVDCQRRASRKAGGAGIRYTCIVEGKPCYIFYEENYQWFLERRGAPADGDGQ